MPEALEGLGGAAWWLEDVRTTIDARKRAYRLYRDTGDRRGAARVATGLSMDHFFEGERAVARGWVQRANRLLEGLEPGPEHGWLKIWEAHMALDIDHHPAAAERFTEEAVALGKSLDDVDLEMLGLAYLGFAMVSQGKISEGMRCLDEATTAAMAGEMSDIDATATACCCLIYACERVRDYGRAARWCEKLQEFCERWSYQLMFWVCRTHYAGILMWRGAWAEAESALQASIGAFEQTRPAQAAEALVRLAELRCRQGRFEEAEVLLQQAESDPFRMMGSTLACLVRGEMALELDDPQSAVDLAERFLRAIAPEDWMERADGLEVLVRARLTTGHHTLAEQAMAELCSIATQIGTEPMRGAARFAEGLIRAAAGDYESAKRHFEDAADLFDRSGAPFETARARLELSRCLLALDRADAAEVQARNALESFQRLGAAIGADRAEALLHQMEIIARKRTGEASAPAGLSRREVEVLRLVAQGLSNQEIAARLVLSEHTVHRHVTSILRKLDLPSRTAAAAYAFRHSLL
jgi:LuxR family maltose regulon positive regulatory protein